MPSPKTVLRALMPLLLLAGSACGLRPVYAPQASGGEVAEQLRTVQIANIPDRHGQELRNLLVDRLQGAGPEGAKYLLAVSISSTESELGIRKDATATRAQLSVKAPFTLTEIESGRKVLSGTSRSIVSYDILDAQYATLVSANNAYDRGLHDVSEDIATRLSLYFADQK